jgi:hypothetical protein
VNGIALTSRGAICWACQVLGRSSLQGCLPNSPTSAPSTDHMRTDRSFEEDMRKHAVRRGWVGVKKVWRVKGRGGEKSEQALKRDESKGGVRKRWAELA